MWNYIRFNIKSNLRRKENMILILLVIVCEVALLFTLNTKVPSETPYQQFLGISTSSVSPSKDAKMYQEFIEFVNSVNQEIEKGNLALKNKDWKTYSQCMVKVNLASAQWYKISSNMPNDSYFEHYDEIETLRREYGVKDLSKYERIIVQKSNNDVDMYFSSEQAVRYFDSLLKQNLIPITYSYVDGASVLLQIARYVFPILLPLLIGLLLFQQKERRIKTKKTILTISQMKKKYMRWNLLSDILFILCIVFIPIFIYMMVLSLMKGVSNFNYPVLYYNPGLFGFTYWDTRGLDEISPVACGLTNMIVNQFLSAGMELIPLWKCSVLIGIGVIIQTIFYVCFLNVFSTFIKNKYLSLVVYLVILGLLSFASPLKNMQKINTLNPMAYRDMGMNLLGTSYFGYFAGIVVLGAYCIVMYLVLKWCTRKVHVE